MQILSIALIAVKCMILDAEFEYNVNNYKEQILEHIFFISNGNANVYVTFNVKLYF